MHKGFLYGCLISPIGAFLNPRTGEILSQALVDQKWQQPSLSSSRVSTVILFLAKRKRRTANTREKSKLPRLVVFDLDGCLWKPELFEIVTSPRDPQGSPFSLNSKDSIPGTTLKSAARTHTVELLGDTRAILHQLFYGEKWYPSLVGISSRTHPPEWAEELLSKFIIYDGADGNSRPPFAMKDVFTPELCLMERDMDKVSQFEILIERANNLLPSGTARLQYKDVIFFDNEAGNCKQVCRLGVTSVYTPRGLTLQAWESALDRFPFSRDIVGPSSPY